MQIRHAKVGTADKNLDLQIDALKSTVYQQIHREKISGKSKVKIIDFDIILYTCTRSTKSCMQAI